MKPTLENLVLKAFGGPTVKQYRLVLSHPEWPRPVRTKWQLSNDFTKAMERAKALNCSAMVEEREIENPARKEMA